MAKTYRRPSGIDKETWDEVIKSVIQNMKESEDLDSQKDDRYYKKLIYFNKEVHEYTVEQVKRLKEQRVLMSALTEESDNHFKKTKRMVGALVDEKLLRQQINTIHGQQQAMLARAADINDKILSHQLTSRDLEKEINRLKSIRANARQQELESEKKIEKSLADQRAILENPASYSDPSKMLNRQQIDDWLSYFKESSRIQSEIDEATANRQIDRIRTLKTELKDLETKNEKYFGKGKNELNKRKKSIFREEERQVLKSFVSNQAGLISAKEQLKSTVSVLDRSIHNNTEEQKKLLKQEKSSSGLLIKLVSGLQKTPLSRVMDIPQVTEKMKTAQNVPGVGMFGSYGPLGRVAGTAGMELLKGVAGRFLAFKTIWDIGEYIVKSMALADKRVTDLARSFSITKEQAGGLYRIIRDSNFEYDKNGDVIAEQIFGIQDLVDTQIRFNEQMGTAGLLSSSMLRSLTSSAKILKLSDDELKGQAEKTILMGDVNKDIRATILATSKFRQLENKIILNDKQVLQDVLKTSGGILANFRNNIESLTKAVTLARQYGMTLDNVNTTMNSLLDWQTSIDSEMEAELLTQRSLNLERARAFALMGDMEGVAREMKDQMGGLNQFLKGNVLQQQALAKAFGFSRDEMADILFKQESMEKIQQMNIYKMDKGVQKMVSTFGDQLVDLTTFRKDYEAIMKKTNITEEERNKQMEELVLKNITQLSAQEKFEASMIMIKEQIAKIFGDGKLLDSIANVLIKFLRLFDNNAEFIMTPEERRQNPEKAKLLDKMNSDELSNKDRYAMIADFHSQQTPTLFELLNPAYGYAKSIRTMTNDLINWMTADDYNEKRAQIERDREANKVNDAIISPKGNVVVSTPFGELMPNKNDYLIATPNPNNFMDKGIVSNTGISTPSTKPDNILNFNNVESLLKQLIVAVQQGDNSVADAVKSGLNISINHTKLNEGALKTNNRL